MATNVLSSKQLEQLKAHKYSAQGTSLSEPPMQIFWRWLVEQCPKSWAPNSMTLGGLIVNIVSTLVLVWYNPDGTKECPAWTYLFCLVGLFVYQSLDAIDGKQARRTGSSSPLGELFDHGCDAVSTVLVMLGCCISLKLGQEPYLLLFELCLSEFCFYLAHWEAYCTGTLQFGPLSVTEGQFTVMFIYLISAINPALWDFNLPILGFPLRILVAILSFLPSLYMMVTTLNTILHGGVGKSKSTVANTSTIFPAVPMGVVIVLQIIISNKTDVYLLHPCLYLITFGLVASKYSVMMVVAHMARSEVYLFDTILFGPGMLFLNQYFNSIVPETFLLWLCFIYCVQDVFRYFQKVCTELCDFLNIYCFDITSKPTARRMSNGKQAKKK